MWRGEASMRAQRKNGVPDRPHHPLDGRPRRSVRRWIRNLPPAQLIASAFAAVILIGTVLLTLPIARAGPGGAPVLEALFNRDQRRVHHRADRGRHPGVLVRIRRP